MPRKRFFFRPMQKGIDTRYPSMHMDSSFANWPSKNIFIDEYSIMKRPGYDTADRSLGYDTEVQQIVIYQLKNGNSFTVYLTPDDLCVKQTGAAETFKYYTPQYVAGNISDIVNDGGTSGGARITGSTTIWSTNVAVGDFFIIDSEWADASKEVDADWYVIDKVSGNTSIDISTNHDNPFTGGTVSYTIRKAYSVPNNERWAYALVDDQFFFACGGNNLQVWDGSSSLAADGDTSASGMVAINPRYCIEYANRLVIADYGSVRDPLRLAWSAEGDPNTFNASDDTTAGSNVFLETESYITGLGKVGTSLVVYKQEALIFGNRTGIATAPIRFSKDRPGIGCVAPYSIIPFMGKNAFIGREDFYIIEANIPKAIGGAIRDDFFRTVGKTEAKKAWGYHNADDSTLNWFASTSEGNFSFVWNYVTEQWTVFQFNDDIRSGGRGLV